jgi:transcriptional regulator with XRE-family HTH domain
MGERSAEAAGSVGAGLGWRTIAKLQAGALGTAAYDIGRNLRSLRKTADLTQEEVAARLGIPRPEVSHWEKGRNLWRMATRANEVAAILGPDVYRMTIEFAEAETRVQSALHDAAGRLLSEYADMLRLRLAAGLPAPTASVGEPTPEDAERAFRCVYRNRALGDDERAWILKTLRENRPRREGRA